MSTTVARRCPRCGASATGRFCGSCGTAQETGACPHCGAPATPEALFCSSCGGGIAGSVEPAAKGGGRDLLPRVKIVLGGLALAAVAWAFLRSAPATDVAATASGARAAPDISNLTPRQQFGRLAERIELAISQGDTATLVQFFPMAEAAFAALSDADRDIDARLHLSLLRARVGHAATAVAQVDSIVAVDPDHLFADYLRAIIADFQGDEAAARAAREAFREHYAAEMATARPEYQLHREMLERFLASIPAS